MGVADLRPVPPGRALAHEWPVAGPLLRLVPQRGIGEPRVQWNGRPRPTWLDVGHEVLGGIDAGRALDLSLRTHLVPGDPRGLAGIHLAERLVAAHEVPSGADPRWTAIRVEVDGAAVAAVQGLVDGYELIGVEFAGRLATVVGSVFDVERFDARYASFRPWTDQRSER